MKKRIQLDKKPAGRLNRRISPGFVRDVMFIEDNSMYLYLKNQKGITEFCKKAAHDANVYLLYPGKVINFGMKITVLHVMTSIINPIHESYWKQVSSRYFEHILKNKLEDGDKNI